MSVVAVMQPAEDEVRTRQRRAASEDDNAPPPGTLETFGASARSAVDSVWAVQDARTFAGYAPLVLALGEKQGLDMAETVRRYQNNGWDAWLGVNSDAYDNAKVWADIERLGGPQAFGLKARNRQEFETGVLSRDGQHQADAETAARGGMVPRLAGAAVGNLADPVNLMGLGAGKGVGLVRGMAIEGATNAGIELAEAPINAQSRRRLGEETTAGDVVKDTVAAFAFGAGMHGTLHVARPILTKGIDLTAAGGRAAYNTLPLDFRAGVAARRDLSGMTDGDLARAFTETVPPHWRTPDERDALNAVERAGEIKAASPFESSYAGQGGHEQRLTAATTQLSTGVAPAVPAAPRGPARGKVGFDNSVYRGLIARGLPEHTARGVAAGIHAESRSNSGIVNPTSGAAGYGQWLGPRKAELIRRYGPNPTPDQQLDFMVWELKGGDHGGKSVLAAGDDAQALNAYVRQFMRPAAGAETTGDLSRGMQALGRGGENIAPDGARGADAPDAPDPAQAELTAAQAAEAADLEARRARLDGEQGAARRGEDVLSPNDDLPALRRDQFDNAAEHRMAQARADADALGIDHQPGVVRQQIWSEARDRLMADKGGVAGGVLYHPDTGPIDVRWGDGKGGLSKIAEKHPEVLERLPELIDQMGLKSRSDNRVVLESLDHRAVVRLDYDGAEQKWLLSAYQVKGKAPPAAVYRGAGDGAQDRSPTRGADADIGAAGSESKLPADLALVGRPPGFSKQDGIHSGFYRFDTPNGPITWDPETGHANGAVPQRSGVSADDIRALVDPAGELRARIERADLARLAQSGDYADPAGAALALQGERLTHDLKRWATEEPDRAYQLGDGEGQTRTAQDVVEELDGDVAAIAAIRGCL